MPRRILLTLLAVMALAVPAARSAVSGAPDASTLGESFFGPRMARAEVLMVVRGAVHDYRVDQGRVTAVTDDSIELLERDGTRQVVPISPTVRLLLNGRPARSPVLRPGMLAIAIRDGAEPAAVVYLAVARSSVPASAGPLGGGGGTSLGAYFFGPRMVRAELVMLLRGAIRDIRVDQGRIVAATETSLELLERDGTRQVVAVSPSTHVVINGRAGRSSSLRPGMIAITIREGQSAADSVYVFPARQPGGTK